MTYSSKELKELKLHLSQEHKISPFSQYLKEIVYGGIDGIVTTFAVVAGFSGAQTGENLITGSVVTVLLFGFANLFADATSMGLGNFLSVRSAQDVYKTERNKERHEVDTNPDMEAAETTELLQQKGFNMSDAKTLTTIFQKNKEWWTEFMMHYELEIANPLGENPIITGLITTSSFLVFGFIPLAPYVLIKSTNDLFIVSILATGVALVILASLRLKVTKESPIRSFGEVMLLGALSATIAYVVGTFFA